MHRVGVGRVGGCVGSWVAVCGAVCRGVGSVGRVVCRAVVGGLCGCGGGCCGQGRQGWTGAGWTGSGCCGGLWVGSVVLSVGGGLGGSVAGVARTS